MPIRSRWMARLLIGMLAATVLGTVGDAQAPWGGFRRSRMPPRFKPAQHRDDGFSFCRLAYTSVRREREGYGWSTDYPAADQNFMIRLSELTSAHVDMDDRGYPNHWVVQLSDPALFTCPFIIASDVGTVGLRPGEGEQLRDYLLKGGFLWVDDFWGTAAWNQWTTEIGRVLPPSDYPITDLALDHPLFKMHYHIWEVPQITNIRFWRRFGGTSTSERGSDSEVAHSGSSPTRRGGSWWR